MSHVMWIALALCVAALPSCSSSKVSQLKADDAKLIKDTPCKDCKSTKKLIRARAMRESMDQQMALQMARSSALEDLASKVNVAVKSVVDDYFSSRKVSGNEEVKRRFEGLTRQVVDQTVRGYRSSCEEYTVSTRPDGTKVYKCYYVAELTKEDAAASLYKGLTKDDKLRLDFEYEKFKAEFEKALEAADDNR